MSVVGRVESVWRYPVKSMRSEELPEIFAGFAGVYGDRLFAFKSTATPAGFPHALAIGDFNTCRAYLDEVGAIDVTAHYMDAIEQIGFHDLWRRRYPDGREYSWFSTRGNGFRIDHAFLSQDLAARAGTIRYSHEDRIAGLSDHSPLILELAV
jgi:exonuclease III